MTVSVLRTIVYVDGFNFYYGEVRGTQWKWLDPFALFEKVLVPGNREPKNAKDDGVRKMLKLESEIIKIRYCTARVIPMDDDRSIGQRQDVYLRALEAHCPRLETHYGLFKKRRARMLAVDRSQGQVQVWKLEEKGSDVNLAVHLLNDAWEERCDCAVIVSNDTDLAESLRLTKLRRPQMLIGLVTPGYPKRKRVADLERHADFVATIKEDMLRRSQLPNPVLGKTGEDIFKPSSW